MWKALPSILSRIPTLFWGVERIIGLAGLPDDYRKIAECLGMIPDWVGISALTAFCIFTWPSAWFARQRQALADGLTVAFTNETPGNGTRVARRIVRSKSLQKVEDLYDDFMAQTHRYREERVFAAFWFKTCKLRGLELRGGWNETAQAALAHQRGVGDDKYWERVIPEAARMQEQLYGDADG